jgi:hypothetical protein
MKPFDCKGQDNDPYTARFTSADSIVPPGVQGLDRYAYANNSPLVFVDPTGHSYCDSQYAFKEDCEEAQSGGSGGGTDPILLSSKAQDLLDFAKSVDMTPEEVIGIGLGHEMFGQSKDERNIHQQIFRNGYLRYVKERCYGNSTYNCMLNYFAGSYESVYNQFLDRDTGYTTRLDKYWGKPKKYKFDQATGNLGPGRQESVIAGIDFMKDFMNTIPSYSYDPVNNMADRDLPLNSGVLDATAFNNTLGYPTREMGFLIVNSVTCPSGAAGYSLVYNWYGEKAIDKAGLKLCE